jgi:tetratricopeptide (TPR) repeat protein
MKNLQYQHKSHRVATFVISLFLATILVSGCKKFLGERADTNKVNIHLVTDLEEILNTSTLSEPNFVVADMFSDDIMIAQKLNTSNNVNSVFLKAYLWMPSILNAADDDLIYNNAYKWILQMNVILNSIDNAEGATPERKAIVKAQAKINRAYYYLHLVNLYGVTYQAGSANQDLGVPIVTVPNSELLPARASIQTIYDLILSDLQDAVNTNALPNFGVDAIHPGKAAALAMLSRSYLYMGNYTKALENADAALAIRSTLLDYNTFSFTNASNPLAGTLNKPFTIRDQNTNPEMLYAKVCLDNAFYSTFTDVPFISDDLQALLGTKDLRYVFGFAKKQTNTRVSYITYATTNMQFNYGIGVPEMMLTKAECLARNGEGTTAIELLNQLRVKRFKPADYVPLVYSTAADALVQVLNERRRELFLHGGVRLFDLKRLNNDARFKRDLQRISDIDGSIIATLPAGSPRYVLPFAEKIIANNPSIVQNPR